MSRRDLIRMSHDEVVAFLKEDRHSMAVATIGPDGRPHLVAMWYGFIGDAVAFWTYGRSQKVVNLRRDPRITVMVESGDSYETLRGVELVGAATVIDDREVVTQVGMSVMARYGGPTGEQARAAAEVMGAKRVAVRIDVERMVSWDHSKLGGTY